ncbi:MAG: hypothetical protein ACI97B_004413, partial [Verrucomicrobiales bacterium]
MGFSKNQFVIQRLAFISNRGRGSAARRTGTR